MLDEELKQFSRFIRARRAFFHYFQKRAREKQNDFRRNGNAYHLDKHVPQLWGNFYEKFSVKSRRNVVKYNCTDQLDYASQILNQFFIAIEKYWRSRSHENVLCANENAEENVHSLFTLSCYTIGRLQLIRSKESGEYTDPGQLHLYQEHMRASIAWEYNAALFENNIHDSYILLILGNICYDIGAHYQARNFVKAAWDLSSCPNTELFATFLAFLEEKNDLEYWIDYFGKSLYKKQNLRIEIRSISLFLKKDISKLFMRYYLLWALDFDRDEFVNSQISDALESILVDVCKDLDILCKSFSLDSKVLLICGNKAKKLRNIINSHIYVTFLICCVWICENKYPDKLSYFVKCLCAPSIVIKTEIDPIINFFGPPSNVEKVRSCLIRNNITSLALAVTLILIERGSNITGYQDGHDDVEATHICLSKLVDDYEKLKKSQKRFLWRYEPLIDSWVNDVSSLDHSNQNDSVCCSNNSVCGSDNSVCGSDKLDNDDTYSRIDNTVSTVLSYSSQQFLLPSTSPCPLTNFSPAL